MENFKSCISKPISIILFLSLIISCKKDDPPSVSTPDYGLNNVFVYYSEDSVPHFKTVWAIIEDDNENIWFGGPGIITRYDGETMVDMTNDFNCDIGWIFCAFKDYNNTIWFGTGSGALKINCDDNSYKVYNASDGLVMDDIRDIFRDNQGNLWFASYDAPGLIKFDGTEWTIIDSQGNFNGWVRNIMQDNDNNLWFAVMGSGILKFNGTGWTKYDGAGGRSVISYNNEIIAGSSGGVAKLENEEFVEFLPELDGADIVCIMVDHENNLWFTNYVHELGYGIAKYNGTTLEKISMENDLNRNQVFTIFEDSKSRIWTGGSGITCFQN